MIAEHVPTLPVASHASQAPPHAASQQTPSTQWALAHSPLAEHPAPLVFLAAHTVPAQYALATQSALLAHVVAQPLLVQVAKSPQLRVPWGVPTTAVQVPIAPGTSHAAQDPVQGVLQHTPSTHAPDSQSAPRLQVVPSGIAT
ncbi:MAG: hypothetical protein IPJ34_02965 [Myxococcales bacterium]|nr:hypothetical protein [Myxococcales bacterium]